MKINTLFFHLRETFSGLRRTFIMTFTTISTVAISLMILGAFLLFYANLNMFLNNLQNQLQVNLYIKDAVSEDQLHQLVAKLKADHRVRKLDIIDKHEALRQMKEELGKDAVLLDNLAENPLPNTISVSLNPVHGIESFRQDYENLPIVQESTSGQDWVQKLFRIINLTKKIGFAILLLLGMGSLSIISNTIRLTVFARRQEIEIMRLVGATNWFVRIPFLLEGIIQGIIGSLIAIAFLAIGYSILQDKFVLLFPEMHLMSSTIDLLQLYTKLLFLGIALGLLASLWSLRRFLV